MTVLDLIAGVLDHVRRQFYTDPETGKVRIREYKRDEPALLRAIATYGYECEQRGWQIESDFIHHDLCQLLMQIRVSNADIQYLPVYLSGAIRRHIGQRAEELSAQSKATTALVRQTMSSLSALPRVDPATQRKPTHVEVLAAVYRGLNKYRRLRRAPRLKKNKQSELF